MPKNMHIIAIFLLVFIAFEGLLIPSAIASEGEFKQVLIEEGLSPEKVETILSALGNVYSPEKIRRNIQWLRDLGVENIGKVLVTYPSILSLSVDDNMKAKAEWLRSQGLSTIGKILNDFPQVFGLSIQDNLAPTFAELTTSWALTPSDIEHSPLLLGASLKRIKELRGWINHLSQFVNEGEFAFAQLDRGAKITCIQNLSAGTLVHYLQQAKVIHPDRNPQDLLALNFASLSELEKRNLKAVFHSGDFGKLLVRKGRLSQRALSTIGSYCEDVLK